MKFLKGYLLSFSLLLAHMSFAQPTPQQMVSSMSRGINVGNVLSAPAEGNWAPVFTESYFEDIASAGFKTVRIPIDFFGNRTTGNTSVYCREAGTASSYNGNPSDYVVSSSYLDRVEQVINWSLSHNLITILDFHGATLKEEFLYTFSPNNKWAAYYSEPTSAKRVADNEKFRAIWSAISNRFKNHSYNLIFEVVNEPYFWLTDLEMDDLNADVISIIRNSGSNNSDRNIIITGGTKNSFESPLQIATSVINSDTHLIATFHYYLPRDFTASSQENHNDFIWGTSADKSQVDADFQTVKTWSESNNIPVLLGEFGADNEGGFKYSTETYGLFGGPKNASRVEYHRYLAQKAIDLDYAFTAWDSGSKSNKTIYIVEDRTWVTGVRNALLGTPVCSTSSIVSNADIECGYNSDWDLFTQTPAVAAKSNALLLNSRNNSTSMQVDVTTEGGAFNTVVLRNLNLENTSLSGKALKISCFAKASTSNQQFKLRLKATVNESTVEFSASPNLNLSTTYENYEYAYSVPENTKSLQLQVLCGNQSGMYFFDDFLVEDLEGLGISNETNFSRSVKLFPNPSLGVIHFKSTNAISKVEVFDIAGKKVTSLNKIINKQIDISGLTSGVYLFKIYNNDNQMIIKKIILN